MTILLIIAKILFSLFLFGLTIAGLIKLLSPHRNPDISPKIEIVSGMIGVFSGLAGLYFTWFD